MFFPLPSASGGLDLAATLESGQAFRWRPTGDGYCGVLDGNVVLVAPAAGGLEVSSALALPEVVWPRLADYFRLEDDLPGIRRAVDVDACIRAALDRYPGLRLLRQDPWECLVAFICSATSNILRISAMVEGMAQAYGESVSLGAVTRHTFPGPERLAEAGEERLRALGLGFRARYVASVARMVVGGELDLTELRCLPYEEAHRALLGVPGVGDKVADCVSLLALDKLEAFPIDRWVHRALEEWYGLPERRPYRELRAWAAEHFGRYAGYAQLYLFHARRLAGQDSSSLEARVKVR